MPLVEKLGAFYLGKTYDLKNGRIEDTVVMYDARDLTTHAVCVGMTGSGKTGLCISLLEEAALDNVPAILIDPKGDLTNLLLTFPELRPEDFEPWVNPDDARRKGMTEAEYARAIAETWRKGLADWDQGPDRIRALKNAAEFRIYTPGSDAGLPVSILASFKCPPLSWDDDEEILRDQIQGTVSALLGLVGITADPLRSREHILLSHIIETAWRAGEDLDLARLIAAIQSPPMRQLGIFDVDTFFPPKDRFALATALNGLIAAPGFLNWMQGEALDINNFLYTATGKPRHSIFYIAHLDDAQRMFFVTLLLEQVITWMRRQPGTTSLRGLLYMDEIFGYFPPSANPPSKRPMLTLLKQARAYGLGIVLTTQNPVDLDYKGLANTGTWFIGKLQTERDKLRVLDGLESVMAEGGVHLNRSQLDRTLSSLDNRVFLLHNVHSSSPIIFYTRWAMSYLRGPLTRSQVRTLMAPLKAQAGAAVAVEAARTGAPTAAVTPASPITTAGYTQVPPTLPPDLLQVYLSLRMSPNRALAVLESAQQRQLQTRETHLVYEPGLLAMGNVTFSDRTRGIAVTRRVTRLVYGHALREVVNWEEAVAVEIDRRELLKQPESQALFAPVPASLNTAAKIKRIERDFIDHLYREQTLELFFSPLLKLYSRPEESERDFKIRLTQAARERRDAEVDALRKRFQPRFDRLQLQLLREQRELEEDKQELAARGREEWLAGAETLAGMLGLGRRRALSSAATRRRMTAAAKAEVAESEAEIARLQQEIDELRRDLETEIARISQRWEEAIETITTHELRPKKTDCVVEMVTLAWLPFWEIGYVTAENNVAYDRVPAWEAPSA